MALILSPHLTWRTLISAFVDFSITISLPSLPEMLWELLFSLTSQPSIPRQSILQNFSVRCPCQAQSSKRYVNSVFVGENLKRNERKPVISPQPSSLGSSIAAAHKDSRLPPFYKLYTSTPLRLLLLSPYLYFPHAPPLCPVPPLKSSLTSPSTPPQISRCPDLSPQISHV